MKNSLKSLTIFVVNLKKDIQKKDYMTQLQNSYSLEFRFIDAVYGKNLSKDVIDGVYNKEKALNYSSRGLSLGEIGCALSHKNIFNIIINENIRHSLILEDDISFEKNIKLVLDNLNLLPQDWETVLLGHHTHSSRYKDTLSSVWWKKSLIDNFMISRPSEIGKGTYGYLINSEGAKKLLNKLNKIYKPIDHYTGNDKDVNVYTISPSPIKVYDPMSEEFHSMDDRNASQVNSLKLVNQYSIKQLLKDLRLFYFVVLIRDRLKQIYPLKKYVTK